jgi:hypothetical protein
MNFDFKITTWERVTVPEVHEEKILEGIKKGEITSANDIFNILNEADYTIIPEVEEQMTVEENGGSSTIEVMNDDGDLVWGNGKN